MTAEMNIELDKVLQPPMANGEVIFEEPWQGRVFGMAVALSQAELFLWSEFQQSLIDVVGDWDRWAEARQADEIGTYQYYEHFSKALNKLLVEKSLLSEQDYSTRVAEFSARPHGHDHSH